MKNAISKIDRALKDLYNLESPLQAQDFLVQNPPAQMRPSGALYIKEPSKEDDSLELGIYLGPGIRATLDAFPEWSNPWSHAEITAFGTAAEEVSHFHYVVHFAPQGRGVSQLELEFQGEIDRFLVTFFAWKSQEDPRTRFENLLEAFFVQFRWADALNLQQKERYETAHRLAKEFLLKHASLLCASPDASAFLKLVRSFYRLSLEEKVSQAKR